jgi:DNA-binding PadR family transcriptional regulator
MYRLEGQGLLDTEWGISDNSRKAKYYQLTAAGRKRLREETAGWQRLSAVMATALRAKLEEI